MSPEWLKISEQYTDEELMQAATDLTKDGVWTPLLKTIYNHLQTFSSETLAAFIAQVLSDRLAFYKRNN